MRTSITLVAAGLALAALSACSGEPQQASTAASAGPAKDSKIAVAANDTECKVAVSEVSSGTSTFAITNGGSKVTEFYVYAPGDRVMGEVENIVPGLTRDVIVELPAGTYETACKPGMIGDGIRNPLKVSGEHTPLTDDAMLADATASYKRYVKSQSDTLLVKTQEFVDAVKAGDIDKAKDLFPSRAPTGSASSPSRRSSAISTPPSTRARPTWRRVRSGPATTGSRRTCGSRRTSPRTVRSPTSS